MSEHKPVSDVIVDEFNYHVARESILDKYPNTDDDTIDRIWKNCGGNPWNALPILEITKLAEKNERTN